MTAAEDAALLELLPDGIASVDPETSWLRPRNAAMRALLGADVEAVLLQQLLPRAAERDRLLGGEAVEVRLGDAWWQLRLLPAVAAKWLLARDITEPRRLLGQALAGARARQLASIAHGVLHDLGNLLGAAIGMAEHLDASASAADRLFLGNVMQGSRQGAELLRTLARQLQDGSRRVGRIDLDAMVAQVVALCAKSAAHRGRELRWQPGAGPFVRGVTEDLEFALLQGLLRALARCRPGSAIAVTTSSGEQALPGGRARQLGAVRIGAPSAWAGDLDGELLQAAMLLRRSGGDLRVDDTQGQQWLVLELPLEVA